MQANVIRTALVQNVGDAELQFFAVFRTSQYEEMSLSDWLRHLPPEMVAQPLECGRSDNLEVAEQSAAHYARVTEPGLAEITVPNLLPSVARLPRTASLAGHLVAGQRLIPEEMAIARRQKFRT